MSFMDIKERETYRELLISELTSKTKADLQKLVKKYHGLELNDRSTVKEMAKQIVDNEVPFPYVENPEIQEEEEAKTDEK